MTGHTLQTWKASVKLKNIHELEHHEVVFATSFEEIM